MSALSKILITQGHTAAGSDLVENEQTKELQNLGCSVYVGHSAEHISNDIDFVVINGAIGADNPEVLYARANNIPIITRDNLLAQIAGHYKKVIAVAGCHGKSTTTAMIGTILAAAGLFPTIHNGAIMKINGVKSNLCIGKDDYFITEACEFKRSFLSLNPTIAVITNVDADHLDCYTDINDIKQTFGKFAKKAKTVIRKADDINSQELFAKEDTITFGINCGDFMGKNITLEADNKYSFNIVFPNREIANYKIKLNVYGRQNCDNALCAAAAAYTCGIDTNTIRKGIESYSGISRRFEEITIIGTTKIIADYAHHPNEIKTAIATANTLYKKYLLIFQPHTYTRTLVLYGDFCETLGGIGENSLAIYKTYAAREKPLKGGRAFDLVKTMRKKGKSIRYFAGTDALTKYIKVNAHKYDAIILCGAGDVVSGNFLKQ